MKDFRNSIAKAQRLHQKLNAPSARVVRGGKARGPEAGDGAKPAFILMKPQRLSPRQNMPTVPGQKRDDPRLMARTD